MEAISRPHRMDTGSVINEYFNDSLWAVEKPEFETAYYLRF